MKIGCFALVEPFSPLGDDLINIPAAVDVLEETGFDGATILEIDSAENVKLSAKRLKEWEGKLAVQQG